MLMSMGVAAGFRRPAWLLTAALVVALAGCSSPLKPRIDAETKKVNEAKEQFAKIRKDVEDSLKREPELFRQANVTAAWRDRFQSDQEKLNDAFSNLERLNHRDKRMSLFADVDRLRDSALKDATEIQKEAKRWLDLKNNTAAHILKMKSDYDKIKSTDVAPIVAKLEKAETDWPAKKEDLSDRVESLKDAPAKAEKLWAGIDEAKAKGDYAELMKTEQWLDSRASRPDKDLKLVSQLYEGRDVILEKLDRPNTSDLTCGAKLKVITTKFLDVQSKKTDVQTKEKNESLPESRCDALKNDVGMEIEHKPAGAYETEASLVPQPPGFEYMAPPGQRNQYGYWETHNGTSVWTWLPEYLILRQMLWGPHYVPVPSWEYNGYWAARRSGTTYYGGGGGYSAPGQVQAPSGPKYGTHGTFTTKRYSDSRYANQGGGYGGSQYATGGSSGYKGSGATTGPSERPSVSGSQGHQFGRSGSSNSSSGSGRRFGGGSRPSSPSSGRRFGGRR